MISENAKALSEIASQLFYERHGYIGSGAEVVEFSLTEKILNWSSNKMKTINEYVKDIHNTAKAKGWWDQLRTAPEIHMLIVTEIAEATEEARKSTPPIYFDTPTGRMDVDDIAGGIGLKVGDVPQKPEGELIELADAVIRIMDYCGAKGWDLDHALRTKIEYNQSRAYRHGGKAF